MATYTTNLDLIKPAGTDKIRIAQLNQNMDTIDNAIGAVGNTSLQSQITTNSQAITALNSKFRYIEGSASPSLSVPSGVFTNVASLSLPSAGTYVITGGFQWSTSINQITVGVLKLENSEITGTTVRTNVGNGSGYNASVVLSVNSATTVYLAAYQGTGDSKNVSSVMLRAAQVG